MSDWADKIAEEKLPCTCPPRRVERLGHYGACFVYKQEVIAAALRERDTLARTEGFALGMEAACKAIQTWSEMDTHSGREPLTSLLEMVRAAGREKSDERES